MNAPVVSSRLNLPAAGNTSSANALELRGVTRLFGALAAISDVTLSVQPGERARGSRLEWRGQDDAVQLHHRGFLPPARPGPFLARM